MARGIARRVAIVVCAGLAVSAALIGCVARPEPSSAPSPPVSSSLLQVFTPKWCEPLLARKDLGLALADAKQDARVTPQESSLASATVASALHAYAIDTKKGVHHSVDPSLIGSATIGSVCVLYDPTIMDGGKVQRPIWDRMWWLSQVRVGLYSGPRFMGEYTVFAEDESTDTMLVDGSYSLAQRAALVLLWDHFGRREFLYRVTTDQSAGSWVIGHAGNKTGGVFLGDCRADASGVSKDGSASKVVKAGVALDEPALAKAFSRAGEAGATEESMY